MNKQEISPISSHLQPLHQSWSCTYTLPTEITRANGSSLCDASNTRRFRYLRTKIQAKPGTLAQRWMMTQRITHSSHFASKLTVEMQLAPTFELQNQQRMIGKVNEPPECPGKTCWAVHSTKTFSSTVARSSSSVFSPFSAQLTCTCMKVANSSQWKTDSLVHPCQNSTNLAIPSFGVKVCTWFALRACFASVSTLLSCRMSQWSYKYTFQGAGVSGTLTQRCPNLARDSEVVVNGVTAGRTNKHMNSMLSLTEFLDCHGSPMLRMGT